jgi:predicted house-cleaning noncanonical NTP pyrophosphatase (MazG superfamily)
MIKDKIEKKIINFFLSKYKTIKNLRNTIELIQKVITFFNFGWVEEREKRVEKKEI